MAGRPGDARAPLKARPPQEVLTTKSPPAEIQVFGRRDSRDTQKALRFFHERRVRVNFVDLGAKAMAPAELKRFSDRFGATNLFDTTAPAYSDAGLSYLSMSAEGAYEKLLRDQRLIRLPLVRAGNRLSAGPSEVEWRDWLRAVDQ
ncbi:MAG: ArsC/Spx/MgsR family protein [Chloroflexota bacterium]